MCGTDTSMLTNAHNPEASAIAVSFKFRLPNGRKAQHSDRCEAAHGPTFATSASAPAAADASAVPDACLSAL